METPGTTTHQDMLVRQSSLNPNYEFTPIPAPHIRKDARSFFLIKMLYIYMIKHSSKLLI